MKRRGFMFTDALIGMMIVAAAAAVMVAASSRVKSAVSVLYDTRSAQRLATEVVSALQTGTEPPKSEAVNVTVSNLEGTIAPEGWRWVTVECRLGRGKAGLTGLVRSGS